MFIGASLVAHMVKNPPAMQEGTVKVLVTESCPILCDPMDCSPPGSSVHGIFQAGIPCPSPGDLPNPGIEPGSLELQVDCLTV